MDIVFDPEKNCRNIRERNLPFDSVVDFDFATALVWQDQRQHYPEARYVAVGQLDARLHVLCCTPAGSGIRVISFRKANAREVALYAQNQTTPPH